MNPGDPISSDNGNCGKNLDAYFNRGVAYEKKGDYDRAVADYTKAIELNEKDSLTYANCSSHSDAEHLPQ